MRFYVVVTKSCIGCGKVYNEVVNDVPYEDMSNFKYLENGLVSLDEGPKIESIFRKNNSWDSESEDYCEKCLGFVVSVSKDEEGNIRYVGIKYEQEKDIQKIKKPQRLV